MVKSTNFFNPRSPAGPTKKHAAKTGFCIAGQLSLRCETLGLEKNNAREAPNPKTLDIEPLKPPRKTTLP